ncbi:MAG TPA: PAS domain-containing sensor histidine kinase [Beijerinckiaceae bacterium]|nr:PAS domain-containing sensor histidine kinase [Beijerinckiaceae bacterium]
MSTVSREEMGHAGLDAALADPALASLRSAGFPILLIGHDPAALLWASEAAFSLFGARDLDELNALALEGADPGARRLRQIVDSPVGEAVRVERLRYSLGGRSEVLTWRCQRSPQAADLLVAAALDWTPRASEAEPAVSPALCQPEPVVEEPQPEPIVAPVGGAQAKSEDSIEADRLSADLRSRFGGARTIRFLWRTDQDNRFTALSGPLCDVVGGASEDLLGHDFSALAERLGLDPDGRLRAALASRSTWANLQAHWPIAGTGVAAPVSLGAAPAFHRDRGFEGWRGFGVIDLMGLRRHSSSTQPLPVQSTEVGAETAEDAVEPSRPAPVQEAPVEHARGGNVVDLRPLTGAQRYVGEGGRDELSTAERLAFREIALALGAKVRPIGPQGEDQAETAAEAELAPEQDSAAELVPDDQHAVPPESKQSARAMSAPPDPRDLLDHSPFGLLASRGEEALWINHTLLAVLGYESEAQFKESGGLARMLKGRTPADLAQTTAIGDMPVINRSGAIAILESASHGIDWEGEPAILTAFRQISDRSEPARLKTLEMELRRREAEARELHSILDTATDGVAVLDERGRLLSLNRAGEALFGYDQNEVAGEPFTVLLANDSRALALDYFNQLASNGVASLLNDGREVMGRARRGGSIPAFMTLGRLNSGPTQKFCAVLRDLTSWKKAERELNEAKREAERASALKSDFLAKVSHEIRTPLNAILGFAEVIMDERFGPVGNERYKDYLKDIHASGAHVMSLVNDLLDLSKIEAGKMELDFGSVDANKIVTECVSIMQPQANSERVIVRLSTTPRLPSVLADERSLRQIVLNLLSNAVKFNEPGGQVIVSTALTDAGHAVIRIRDTGIGMSESDLVTALEPFRQLQTARQSSGTGLGLPLTKALVEANRASFSVKSRKNEGTLVEVAFPPARVMAE